MKLVYRFARPDANALSGGMGSGVPLDMKFDLQANAI
jgi:hypothetical protein